MTKTQKLTTSSLIIAIGVIAGHLLMIPVGVAKCYPLQHLINVLSAILLGPWYAVANAFVISLLRNILGVGSLLAFPGSMIGALFAGLLYKYSKNMWLAMGGELVGTGVIGAIVGWPIAVLLMGKEVAAFTFVVPFMVSSLGGVIIAAILLQVPALKRQVVLRHE